MFSINYIDNLWWKVLHTLQKQNKKNGQEQDIIISRNKSHEMRHLSDNIFYSGFLSMHEPFTLLNLISPKQCAACSTPWMFYTDRCFSITFCRFGDFHRTRYFILLLVLHFTKGFSLGFQAYLFGALCAGLLAY